MAFPYENRRPCHNHSNIGRAHFIDIDTFAFTAPMEVLYSLAPEPRCRSVVPGEFGSNE
jgi:hypothetical protein